jgi:putative serine protease PepD
MLLALVLAGVIGGVAGGLIVRATRGTGNGSSAAPTGSNGTAAACPAATVADRSLPSVVTVRAANAQQAGSGSGVVIRSGGYILTNNHVISVAAAAARSPSCATTAKRRTPRSSAGTRSRISP